MQSKNPKALDTSNKIEFIVTPQPDVKQQPGIINLSPIDKLLEEFNERLIPEIKGDPRLHTKQYV